MLRTILSVLAITLTIHCASAPLVDAADATPKPRARDFGIPFDGVPGKFNAITDVDGVLVGQTTLISGSGKLKVGAARPVIDRALFLRWLVCREWQRRDDRYDLGRGIRLP
jgi:hypothetical protein